MVAPTSDSLVKNFMISMMEEIVNLLDRTFSAAGRIIGFN